MANNKYWFWLMPREWRLSNGKKVTMNCKLKRDLWICKRSKSRKPSNSHFNCEKLRKLFVIVGREKLSSNDRECKTETNTFSTNKQSSISSRTRWDVHREKSTYLLCMWERSENGKWQNQIISFIGINPIIHFRMNIYCITAFGMAIHSTTLGSLARYSLFLSISSII